MKAYEALARDVESIDWLTWGDTKALTQAQSGTVNITTLQLVKARRKPPTNWHLAITIVSQPTPAETGVQTVTLNYTIGCGKASARFSKTYTLTSTSSPPYGPIFDVIGPFPAEDIQVDAQWTGTTAGPYTMQVSGFIAPVVF